MNQFFFSVDSILLASNPKVLPKQTNKNVSTIANISRGNFSLKTVFVCILTKMHKNHHIFLKEKNFKNRKIKEKGLVVEDSYLVPEMVTACEIQNLTFNMFYLKK